MNFIPIVLANVFSGPHPCCKQPEEPGGATVTAGQVMPMRTTVLLRDQPKSPDHRCLFSRTCTHPQPAGNTCHCRRFEPPLCRRRTRCWFVRAPVPISGNRGSHDQRGRGADADSTARQCDPNVTWRSEVACVRVATRHT